MCDENDLWLLLRWRGKYQRSIAMSYDVVNEAAASYAHMDKGGELQLNAMVWNLTINHNDGNNSWEVVWWAWLTLLLSWWGKCRRSIALSFRNVLFGRKFSFNLDVLGEFEKNQIPITRALNSSLDKIDPRLNGRLDNNFVEIDDGHREKKQRETERHTFPYLHMSVDELRPISSLGGR